MESISLYRRWRSQTFSEIVGQKHITKTLQNVLKNRKLLSHAYLFCGPRGTGKTSMARIFAKALNCTGNTDEPPCNVCPSCIKITKGLSMDIMEIDAASHTSVEMVREYIIDKVNFAPMEGRFKVYIIDEVHKLSNSSFNALLKTLEEPPSHVIFILATTHPHELLPTILSRCQRFDFKRISQNDITSHLRDICHKEGYVATENALNLIASVSSGALRDALVILEQSFSFSDGEITPAHITSLLGISERSLLFTFSQLIAEEKIKDILYTVDTMFREGKDIFQFVKDLTEHYRCILLAKFLADSSGIIEATEEDLSAYKELSALYTEADLMRIIKIASDLLYTLRDSFCERPLLEVALIKMASKNLDVSMTAMKQRIDALEKSLKSQPRVDLLPENTNREPLQNIQEKKDIGAVEIQTDSSSALSVPEMWPKVLQAVKASRISIHAVLIDTKPVFVNDDEIVLQVKDGFNFHKTQIDNNLEFIADIVSRFAHRKIRVRSAFTGGSAPVQENIAATHTDNHKDFVRDVMDIFGGKPV